MRCLCGLMAIYITDADFGPGTLGKLANLNPFCISCYLRSPVFLGRKIWFLKVNQNFHKCERGLLRSPLYRLKATPRSDEVE